MNYKYNIIINQKAIVDNRLAIDIVDAAIFDFIKDFSHSDKCAKMQIDGKTYFWITNQTIIDNLPLLQISTPRGISKRIDNLVNAELLVRCPNNKEINKTLYAFGRRYDEYIFTSESRPWNESSDLGTTVPTPWNESSDDNNNKNNNIIIIEEAHAHTHERVFGNSKEGDIYQVLFWVTDNEEGLRQMLYRNKLINGFAPLDEMVEIIKPYVEEYYNQQLMNGGEDIIRRGRRDIKQHFSQWLPKYIKKIELEQQQKQQEYEQSVDAVTRAMQDFERGWDYAASRATSM